MLLRCLCTVLLGTILLAGGPTSMTGAPRAQSRSAAVIAIEGTIGVAQAAYVTRALRQAQADGSVLIVLRLDTPGGLDVAMREIIEARLA